jgi:hypothetical protein
MNLRKSGTNLHLALTGETYDGIRAGTRNTLGTGNQRSLSDGSIPCWQVTLQASLSNAGLVLVGAENGGCTVELNAGGSVDIPINDVSKIFINDEGAVQTVNWLALF